MTKQNLAKKTANCQLPTIKQTNFNQIYGDLNNQKEVIGLYLAIDKMRISMKEELLYREEIACQDLAQRIDFVVQQKKIGAQKV